MKNLTLRMSDELHEMLVGAATDRGKSLNGIVCELLSRGMTEYGLRRALVEAVRTEIRAEFEGRKVAATHAESDLARKLDDLFGPAAYHRINGMTSHER